MRSIRYVYIAGPLTTGDWFVNCRNAFLAGERLRAAGFAPYVPHASLGWQLAVPAVHYEAWMALDFAWIERCDALVRLPGPSAGSDREVEFARKVGLPVFLGVDCFLSDAPAVALSDGFGRAG